jgi:hypothetical protein
VPAGSRVRLTASLAAAEEIKGGVQATVDAVMDLEGTDKPVCVAQMVHRYYAAASQTHKSINLERTLPPAATASTSPSASRTKASENTE